jgi:molybdenum cofactor biosynthesis enzyme MoaA
MKIREDQLRIRTELQKQMDQHKIAKAEEKKGDLEYFEYIRTKKEEQEREQRDKKDGFKKLLEEQKLVRDRQIEEHNRAKYMAEKEKKRDADKLKSMF